MVKGKPKTQHQDSSTSSKLSKPIISNPRYPNKPEKQDSDLKSYLMMLVEDFKKDSNNSLKEIQENTTKRVELLKEKTQKSLEELQENTDKQVEVLKEEIQKSL
jgi:DNA repair exonuclease SbcCD nuclease subunit